MKNCFWIHYLRLLGSDPLAALVTLLGAVMIGMTLWDDSGKPGPAGYFIGAALIYWGAVRVRPGCLCAPRSCGEAVEISEASEPKGEPGDLEESGSGEAAEPNAPSSRRDSE